MGQYSGFRVVLASPADREEIYRLRHAVYADELGQHPTNRAGSLRDGLDDFNEYLVAYRGETLAGFVSITPPGRAYSLDKYLPRADWPFPADERLFEVRLLTVLPEHRHSELGALLMYALLQNLAVRGARNVVAIGRREVLPLYRRVGLETFGHSFSSGAVTFELMGASVESLLQRSRCFSRLIARRGWDVLLTALEADPEVGTEEVCYHGGAFFEAVGANFSDLNRRHAVINADVLDAWFPPAPGVLSALRENLPWLLRTSPPTQCEGLRTAIAEARGVPESSLVLGAGSSDLIFRAFQRWLTPSSRVLVLDPTYGEYKHVLENVIGCSVVRVGVSEDSGYQPDLDRLVDLGSTCDLVVLVNPNNPTGAFVPAATLADTLGRLPDSTRVWVDEAYTDYVGPHLSIEKHTVNSRNVVVCKSLSKVLALSGMRAGYLVAPEPLARDLRQRTPPWVIGLPSQVAAVCALKDPAYYAACYAETRSLQADLHDAIRSALPTVRVNAPPTNWLLCHLPPHSPTAAEVVTRCRAYGVFLRDVSGMGQSLGSHTLRVAVKDAPANRRIVEALASCGIPVS